jgi:hypothetical protein
MDFFSEHPDDVAARERELVVDLSEVQADVLTTEQSSVPHMLTATYYLVKHPFDDIGLIFQSMHVHVHVHDTCMMYDVM